ncbi:MAG: hypothetical protein HYR67_06325 [Bacteroidetes bacterium]|nr:hypothetical protein [Bacteroidota bacterium]
MLKGLKCSIFFAIGIMLDGCSYSDTMRIPGQLYFPLRVGNYQIYQVSETNILHLSCNDTDLPPERYELKVLIYDSSKNAEGGYAYFMHRYTRPDSTQVWSEFDTWSARATTNQVIVNEGNTSYVKLFFPFVNNSKWNGNQYNNLAKEDYVLKNYGQSYQLSNEKKYSTTLTVEQSDNQDFFVYQDKRVEVYAVSIGLIYKETTQLTYFQNPCYGQQKVKTGIIYTQMLKSYGRE